MKNKLDNILLSTLWLSATTLVACFWFNIKFGFNLFSGAHWRHLAYMQANQAPVNTTFYISIIAFIVIAISGLYLLLRPRIRKITLPIRDTHTVATTPTGTPQHTAQTTQRTTNTVSYQSTHGTQQQSQQPLPQQSQPNTPAQQISENGLSRPPRLNLGTPLLNQTESFTAPATSTTVAPVAPVAPVAQTSTQSQAISNSPEVDEIFESAGYTLKKAPRIGRVQTSLFAIGTDETLWIGAVGIETSALQTAIDSVQQIFSDTLEDIEINVHGFVISARDASAPTAPNILVFDSADTLRNYISEHPNTPPSADDMENFEAFSSYISTVIEYLGKM